MSTREFTLERINNQSFTAAIGESFYELRLSSRNGSMLLDVWKNNAVVVLGARVVAGAPIIQPYSLLPDENFVMITRNGELVDFNQFGITQFLFHVSTDGTNRIVPSFPVPIPIPMP